MNFLPYLFFWIARISADPYERDGEPHPEGSQAARSKQQFERKLGCTVFEQRLPAEKEFTGFTGEARPQNGK
jgi:hypothetical protein